MNSSVNVITLEGSIGAGKTTLLNGLRANAALFNKPITILLEPVDDWMNFKPEGETDGLFKLYYKDKKKFGFMFQMVALQTRISDLLNAIKTNPGHIIICERCYLTDNALFAKILHDDGYITDMEYKIYTEWFKLMEELMQINLTAVLYLRTDPDVCVSRIIKRSRSGEEDINMAYIRSLHQHHETWIKTLDKDGVVLTIDGNPSHIMIEPIIEFVNNRCAFLKSAQN